MADNPFSGGGNMTPLKGKKVLIADRQASTRMALRDMVQELGVSNVLNAGSAGDVIRMVKNGYIDIILCEYKLDEVRDGQQLLEELRHERLIPLSTMFMMITNERGYQQVVAVAEFAPDDYLLKPFTPEQLYQRLLRANQKKDIFMGAYSCVEDGKIEQALQECDLVIQAHPKFIMDALRLKIDILTTVGRTEEAEKLLETVLASRASPWAQMGLAQVRYRQDRLEDAEQICESLLSEKGEFLAAYDFLAKVKQEMGKDEEALGVLEKAASYSSFNVRRMRKTAEVAEKTGDLEKATRLYNKVIDRVRDSSLIRSEDFAKLSNVYIQQGRFDDADRVSADLKRTMKATDEMEVASCFIAYQKWLKQGDKQKAVAALDKTVTAYKTANSELEANMEADLAEACFRNERTDDGFNIARKIALRTGVDRPVLNRIRNLLSEFKKKPATAKPGKVTFTAKDLVTNLSKLDQEGWDEEIGNQCRDSLSFWAKHEPNNPNVAVAKNLLAGLMRKYGIAATVEEIEMGRIPDRDTPL
ncbi:tetratricopeptide repeat-containing response regulator [Parvibium lacunae]|uniref:Response regulator n=1 Tax=Parvibium lacunae TaxID=1888893 RepID=A0A368L4Z1_9BURK|nr:tetratricopeptide repeat-containing response regulator [Parvibium lacunae]RCS58543.1 response regulator [Parvibium lacunae]